MTTAVRRGNDRIGELIVALESVADAQGRDCARQLVQEILELHAVGLSRMLEIAAERDRTILDTLAYDGSVMPLLLLHGLHPQELSARVRQAVDGLRGTFGVMGMKIELSDIVEDTVRLRFSGKWHGKNISAERIKSDVEEAIFALAPEIATIEIDNLPDADVHEMKFVPVSALRESREGSHR